MFSSRHCISPNNATFVPHRIIYSWKEFDLLCALARQPGKVFGYEMLLEQVWGVQAQIETRVVSSTIAELRRKLEPNREIAQYILTERGVGYRFRDCQG